MKRLALAIGSFALLGLTVSPPSQAYPADAQGCSDSPLITRISGSTLTACHNDQNQQVSMRYGEKMLAAISSPSR